MLRHMLTLFTMLTAILMATATPAAAQHGYSLEDIDRGRMLYGSTCAGCHGPDGDRVAGVALAGGVFKRAAGDDEVVRIIVNGIQGTSMPASKFSDAEAGAIVAYLRTMKTAGGTVAPGDAARGRALFEGKGNCGSCHGTGGPGSRLAPSLAEAASTRRPIEIERAILDPSAAIAPDFQQVRVVLASGPPVVGRLLNQDTFSVQLLDANERLRSFDKAKVREVTLIRTSPMPAYRNTLTPQDVVDLVAYVRTLGGRK
jgi:putative heme-binding domain-containing protein